MLREAKIAVPCEIGFKQHGEEMQFVEMILNENERVVARPGTIMYKDGKIDLVVQHLTLAEKTGKQ